VSLDDLLAVVPEFPNPDVSRLGLDRCLRRHRVGHLRDLKVKAAPKHSGFKAYEPGYIHIDLKYLPQLLGECRHSPARQGMQSITEMGPPAGSSSASTTPRRQPMPVASCVIWSVLVPSRDIALQCPAGQGTTEKSSLTVSLVYASEPRRADTPSTNSAPNWTLSIVSPRQGRRNLSVNAPFTCRSGTNGMVERG